VLVGGRWVIRQHRHEARHRVAGRFEAAMRELWSDA
jgi:hypothetical protein